MLKSINYLQALGMGAFLAVAKASEMPAKLIHVKYTPPGGLIYRRVAIVGKGTQSVISIIYLDVQKQMDVNRASRYRFRIPNMTIRNYSLAFQVYVLNLVDIT